MSRLFLVCSLGLGLLVSTLAETQLAAVQFAFVIMLPSVLLSGLHVSSRRNAGADLRDHVRIPVTYFIEILRGIVLRCNTPRSRALAHRPGALYRHGAGCERDPVPQTHRLRGAASPDRVDDRDGEHGCAHGEFADGTPNATEKGGTPDFHALAQLFALPVFADECTDEGAHPAPNDGCDDRADDRKGKADDRSEQASGHGAEYRQDHPASRAAQLWLLRPLPRKTRSVPR